MSVSLIKPIRTGIALVPSVFCMLCLTQAFADEPGEPGTQQPDQVNYPGTVTEIKGANSFGENQAGPPLANSPASAQSDSRAGNLAVDSSLTNQDINTLQDLSGVCLVVEGLLSDFCAQYPEDSGCLAVQQLNSQ